MRTRILLLFLILLLVPLASAEKDIFLHSRQIQTGMIEDTNSKHVIIQFDHTLSESERTGMEDIRFISYIPKDSWIVSVSPTKLSELKKDLSVVHIEKLKREALFGSRLPPRRG